MYREPIYSRSLRQCASAVEIRPSKRDYVSANTERLEQFSSIGRSPIVKPFMPAGYARHLFLFFFGVGRPRSPPPPAFPSCRSNVIIFGYSSFPPESPSRFLRKGTFDTRSCVSLAALLRCNCIFFHPLRISCDSRVLLHSLLLPFFTFFFFVFFVLHDSSIHPSFLSTIHLFPSAVERGFDY